MSYGIATAANEGRRLGLRLMYNDQRSRTTQYIRDLEAKLSDAWNQIQGLREDLRQANAAADRNAQVASENLECARKFALAVNENADLARNTSAECEELRTQVRERNAFIIKRNMVVEQQKAEIADLAKRLEQSYNDHVGTGYELTYTEMRLDAIERRLAIATLALEVTEHPLTRTRTVYEETGFLVKARHRGLDDFTQRERLYARGNEISSFQARFMRYLLAPTSCCLDSLIRSGAKITVQSIKPAYSSRAWARYSAVAVPALPAPCLTAGAA